MGLQKSPRLPPPQSHPIQIYPKSRRRRNKGSADPLQRFQSQKGGTYAGVGRDMPHIRLSSPTSNENIIKKASEMIRKTSVNGYVGSCEAIKKLNYLREIGKVKNDFLFVSGEKDVGAPALAMEEMHHLTPNSKYICITDVAHVFNLEKPNEVNKILAEFLS